MMKKMNIELTTRVKKAYAVTMLTTMIAFSFSGIGSTVAYISTNATVSSLNFSGLQNTYPSNSKWNSSFMNKAW